ncbi:MAG: VWA domain-containing protein [Ruminococcus sp.]|uniref:VWA domain-containing protein n=1 Tax=Ruminococcus sp. TaxID=41978 RepID=UPI0025CD36B0|nr:VWA domain-containing protein [Ruminococcus sp.]MCR4796729.1 VWA domain-containing protein [Ruminococcus sp.]
MEIQRGMRDKLEKYMDTTKMIEVKLNIVGNAVYDFSCFGVDADNQLSDDRYMVFYNQTKSPNGEIEYVAGNNCAVFKVMTNSIPASIQRLVFTASIDGIGTMGEIAAHTISVGNTGTPSLTANFAGTVFNNEKAIISIELYRKNEWRFSVTASGFNGGIQDLLHYFGGTEAEEAVLTAPQAAPEPPTPPTPPTPPPAPTPSAPPQPEQPQPPFGQPQPQFGQPQPQFGQPQSQFGQPQPQFGQPTPPPMPNQGYGYGGHTRQPMPFGGQPPYGQPPQFGGQPVPPPPMGGQPPQFGGAPVPPPPAPPAPSNKVSLEKKLSKAPALVSLAKPIMVQLEKKNLTNTVARVGLVMDITGSMYMAYKSGIVQDIVNKILPLAVQFDDDGQLDFWYYAQTFAHRPAVDLGNYTSAVPDNWKEVMNELGGTNNEPEVIKDIIEFYRGSSQPVYIIFITDGGMAKKGEIKKLMKQASEMPIFWQFVGVEGSNYGILENLDELEGRYVDNAGFFAMDDYRAVSNDELYDRLLSEFPVWLNEAKRLGLVR